MCEKQRDDVARRLEGVQGSLASAEQRELQTAEQLRQTQEDLALKAEENGIMQERYGLAHHKTPQVTLEREQASKNYPSTRKLDIKGSWSHGVVGRLGVRRGRRTGGGHGGGGDSPTLRKRYAILSPTVL